LEAGAQPCAALAASQQPMLLLPLLLYARAHTQVLSWSTAKEVVHHPCVASSLLTPTSHASAADVLDVLPSPTVALRSMQAARCAMRRRPLRLMCACVRACVRACVCVCVCVCVNVFWGCLPQTFTHTSINSAAALKGMNTRYCHTRPDTHAHAPCVCSRVLPLHAGPAPGTVHLSERVQPVAQGAGNAGEQRLHGLAHILLCAVQGWWQPHVL
jgi:hypothetical protein